MLRLFLLLFIVTSLSLGLTWLAETPGSVTLDWGHIRVEMSVLTLAALLGAACIAFMLLYACVHAMLRAPSGWMRSRAVRRQSLGLSALTHAFAAIATQDGASAKRELARANHYLPGQPLTLMLSAQLARMEGNETQARLYLEKMLASEGAEFMAMRGLIENARKANDDGAALRYAEKALALKPQDSWLIVTAAGLYTRLERASDAVQLLELSARRRYITKAAARKWAAEMLFEHARQLLLHRRVDSGIAALEDALKKHPGFAAAAELLAEQCLGRHETRRALKVTESAWHVAPHPLLTYALLRAFDTGDDRKKVIAVIEKVGQHAPDHPESAYLLAEFYLKREEYAAARSWLDHAMARGETVRACRLMADVENAQNDHEAAAQWLKRADQALQGPGYVCDSCLGKQPYWTLACEHCGTVGALEWQ